MQENENIENRLNTLLKDEDWLKISGYWKQLNSLNSIFDPNFKVNKLVKLGKPFEDNPETSQLDECFQKLSDKKLLLIKENDFLKQIIAERYQHISGIAGLYMCYFTGGIPEVKKVLNDLEKQYYLMEKLYKDDKINSDTSELVKKKIHEDLKSLHATQSKLSTDNMEVNDELLTVLIQLNR